MTRPLALAAAILGTLTVACPAYNEQQSTTNPAGSPSDSSRPDSSEAPIMLVDTAHDGPVIAVGFSHAGDEVISISAPGLGYEAAYRGCQVTRNSVADGQRLRHDLRQAFFGHSLLLPNGKTISGNELWAGSGSEEKFVLYDLATGQQIDIACQDPDGEGGWINASAMSGDRRRVTLGGRFYYLPVYDVASGALIAELPGASFEVTAMSLDSSGSLVACAGAGSVELWNVDSATRTAIPVVNASSPEVAVSDGPNGVVAVLDRERLTLYTHEGVSLATFKGVTCFDLATNSPQIAIGGPEKVRLFDTATGASLDSPSHGARVTTIAISPVGDRVVFSDTASAVHLWSVPK